MVVIVYVCFLPSYFLFLLTLHLGRLSTSLSGLSTEYFSVLFCFQGALVMLSFPFLHCIPLLFYKYASNLSEDMVRISVILSTSPLFSPEFPVFSTPLILHGHFSYALCLFLPPALCVWEFLAKSSHLRISGNY